MFQRSRQFAASLLTFALISLPVQAADWQPRPLVDTTPKPAVAEQAPQAAAEAQPAAAAKPDVEKMLKPAEPFIADVEKNLYLSPKAGDTLVNRLDKLQMVLYGERKYQDAGELLAKLAEIYPQEAAKAQAELNRQMQQLQASLPPVSKQKNDSKSPSYSKAGDKSIVTYPAPMASSQSMPQQPKAKRSFWGDRDDDPFANDPFFNDDARDSQAGYGQTGGGPRLAGIGQGLASLAMIAGSLAGSYYLNKKLGGPTDRFYGNQPYDPYGYYNGSTYYGNGGGYYYNNPYGYAPPYGAYPPGVYAPPGQIYDYSRGRYTVTPYRQTSPLGTLPRLGMPIGY